MDRMLVADGPMPYPLVLEMSVKYEDRNKRNRWGCGLKCFFGVVDIGNHEAVGFRQLLFVARRRSRPAAAFPPCLRCGGKVVAWDLLPSRPKVEVPGTHDLAGTDFGSLLLPLEFQEFRLPLR